VKGKAAIDVVCNPLGKSGGALIQQCVPSFVLLASLARFRLLTPPHALRLKIYDFGLWKPCCQHPVRALRVAFSDLRVAGFSANVFCFRYLGVILLGVVLSWLKSAASLNTQFMALAENDEELKAELA
jgi:hypothetical protein